MKKKHVITGLIFFALLTGCASVGPPSVERDYPRYNQTIRDIEDEHLLLNLVRLRYLETPVFLQVSSISTSYGISVSGGVSVAGASGTPVSGGADVGAGYSETPTITYSLPDSRKFFGRMVAPLSTAQLSPLAVQGIGGYFKMGLKRINGLENVSSYTGWTAEVPASYAEFEEAMELMQELERFGLIDFIFANAAVAASSPFDQLGEHSDMAESEKIGMEYWKNEDGKWVALWAKRVPYMRFSGAAANDPRAIRLRELLRLDPRKHSFPIVDVDFSTTESTRLRDGKPAAALDPEAVFGEIVTVNRSMMEILGMASRSVQVPTGHLQAGLVAADEDVFGDLLTIQSSEVKPTNAAVVVKHKGIWFYIAADDLSSKMTLLRLNSLFEATAGRVAGTQPILTIPVK